jgi:anti-anti-sigma factor
MQVKVTRLGAGTYIAPDFALVEDKLAPLHESVTRARSEGVSELVILLDRVPVLDSKGLTYLVDLSNELRQLGGSLRLVATDLCREILAVTRVDRTIAVFDTIEEAGRSFL